MLPNKFLGVRKFSGLTAFTLQMCLTWCILTGAVGLITSVTEAEQILNNQQADVIILARQLLRDPYFPLHAANELGDDIVWPVQYDRAKR